MTDLQRRSDPSHHRWRCIDLLILQLRELHLFISTGQTGDQQWSLMEVLFKITTGTSSWLVGGNLHPPPSKTHRKHFTYLSIKCGITGELISQHFTGCWRPCLLKRMFKVQEPSKGDEAVVGDQTSDVVLNILCEKTLYVQYQHILRSVLMFYLSGTFLHKNSFFWFIFVESWCTSVLCVCVCVSV